MVSWHRRIYDSSDEGVVGGWGRANVVVLVAGILLVSSLIALAGILAGLPRAIDDFLLTNEDYCYIISSGHTSRSGNIISVEECSSSMRGEFYSQWNTDEFSVDEMMMFHDTSVDDSAQVQNHEGKKMTKLQRMTNFILWKVALHLWKQSTNNDADTTPPIEFPTSSLHGRYHDDEENVERPRYLHPMCDGYRKLRSRIRFEQLYYPWSWYFTSSIRMRKLTLRSLKRNVQFETRKHYSQWMFGWSILPEREMVSPTTIKNYVEHSDSSFYSQSHYPPSMEIETLDIDIQSAWVHPVISAEVHGIIINVVIQSGEFVHPLHRSNHDHRKLPNDRAAFLIGDMTLKEVSEILPKPPELEGLYPRIGLVNITNVTLCVYDNKEYNNSDSPSLKELMKIRVPDRFFFPIITMTLAHRKTGIDRKHFQKMMESSLYDAFHQHLLREAQAAFRNSWISAHKAQDQLQQLVIRTQELYLKNWFDLGANAWKQVIEHGTVPILRAIEDWASDLREIVSEPVPPLIVVLSHYWNLTMDGINRHGIAIDEQVWGHLNEMVTNVNHFHREKRLSKHLSDLKEAFEGFIAKSGQDIETLVKNCEIEVKDMWLAWHRQFMPDFIVPRFVR